MRNNSDGSKQMAADDPEQVQSKPSTPDRRLHTGSEKPEPLPADYLGRSHHASPRSAAIAAARASASSTSSALLPTPPPPPLHELLAACPLIPLLGVALPMLRGGAPGLLELEPRFGTGSAPEADSRRAWARCRRVGRSRVEVKVGATVGDAEGAEEAGG